MKTHSPFSLPNIQYTLNGRAGQTRGTGPAICPDRMENGEAADLKRVPLPDKPEGEESSNTCVIEQNSCEVSGLVLTLLTDKN
jgi:hypothetical protein